MIRFSRRGGVKSFEFFDSFDSFKERLTELPPRTCVIVFAERQLPIRGVVDDELIGRALECIANGSEYLIAGLSKETCGKASWFPDCVGSSHNELSEDLNDMRGKSIALGNYPQWQVDGDEVVSALVPDLDGSLHAGI